MFAAAIGVRLKARNITAQNDFSRELFELQQIAQCCRTAPYVVQGVDVAQVGVEQRSLGLEELEHRENPAAVALLDQFEVPFGSRQDLDADFLGKRARRAVPPQRIGGL